MNMASIKNFDYPIPKPWIAQQLRERPNPVILEIGCNDGKDTLEFMEQLPRIHLHAFEPDPRPRRRFEKSLGAPLPDTLGPHHQVLHNPRMSTTLWFYPVAIGERDGDVPFFQSNGNIPGAHVVDWDLSGSIREPTGHLKRDKQVKFERMITVPCWRLDTWMSCVNYPIIDFIWMDVQGAEGDVIRGGPETLKRTRMIYTEFYNVPQYEGQPNLQQILDLLGPTWKLVSTFEGYNALIANAAQ